MAIDNVSVQHYGEFLPTNIIKCDTSCGLQNLVNRQNFERTLPLPGNPWEHACRSVYLRQSIVLPVGGECSGSVSRRVHRSMKCLLGPCVHHPHAEVSSRWWGRLRRSPPSRGGQNYGPSAYLARVGESVRLASCRSRIDRSFRGERASAVGKRGEY